MKILSIFALSALALTATAQSYTITGKADAKYNGKNVYLINQDTPSAVDTCVIADGAFAFKGVEKDQSLYEININNNRRMRGYVIVEPGAKITVDLTAAPAKVSGGLNDKLAAIEEAIAKESAAMNELVRQMQSEGKTREQMMEVINPRIEALYGMYRKEMMDNKDNMIGAYILGMVAGEFYPTIGEFDTVAGQIKHANKVYAVRTYREDLVKAEATQPGKMFVDFGGLTVDGKPSRLSDYVGKGKYVLVDFWASWCGPCKGEIPNLIELQNKYGGDKFTVLGVNVWDEEAKFKSALQAEGITYPQIFIPRDNKDNATGLYGIKGIPQIILFAPDGTILKRDLRGNDMKNYVGEQLSK